MSIQLPYHTLHKRPNKSDYTKNENYDQESGDYQEYEKNTNQDNKNSAEKYNLITKFILSFAVMILFFGFYVDIFASKKINNEVHLSIENQNRILKENKEDCKRENFENVSKYLLCHAENNQILILSDTSEHVEYKDKYSKYDVEFKHINEIFTNITDYLEFMKIVEEQSPWIFVEGTFIGNEKELEQYEEHEILKTGLEFSEIKPTLNENEINLLSSTQIDEDSINLLKVRQYLRRHLPMKEVDKEMSHIKHLFQAHKNIRTSNNINKIKDNKETQSLVQKELNE